MLLVWCSPQGLRQLTHSQAEVLLMAAASLADTDSVLTGDLPACMTCVHCHLPLPLTHHSSIRALREPRGGSDSTAPEGTSSRVEQPANLDDLIHSTRACGGRSEEQAESLLASVGMQPSVMTVGAAAAALRVRQAEETESDSAEESSAEESIDGHDDADRHLWRRLLFTATKRSPSQLQQEVYLEHVHRAMTEGEDGFDD